MGTRARKLFEVKDGRPGSPVTWKHVNTHGSVTERTGLVWSDAPSCGSGTKAPLWVAPDEPSAGDLYPSAVVVATWNARWGGPGGVKKGERYSDESPSSPMTDLARGAWRRSAAGQASMTRAAQNERAAA